MKKQMVVKTCENSEKELFCNLGVGEVFLYDGYLWMSCYHNCSDDYYLINAINLETGETVYLEDNIVCLAKKEIFGGEG